MKYYALGILAVLLVFIANQRFDIDSRTGFIAIIAVGFISILFGEKKGAK